MDETKNERGTHASVAAVVPSLHPDGNLKKTVSGLLDEGFETVVLIDDGSGGDYAQIFAECASLPGVRLLRHEVNRGKGAALKRAFAYVLDNLPDCTGVVTVDGDGQHLPGDVAKCADAMVNEDTVVLGVRDFSSPEVPAHNRRGNKITSGVFRIFCGMKVSDTQTGLRAIPRGVLEQLVQTKGDRYEFETQMLLDFKRFNVPFKEVTIHTVYLEENKTSHFRVVRDSFRIYRLILAHFFKYSASSILSVLLETLIIYLILGKTDRGESVIFNNTYAFLIARACSSFFNMNVNYFAVFRTKCSYPKALAKYYAVALPVAAVTLGFNLLLTYLVNVWNFLPENVEHYSLVVINLIVQAIIFVFTFKMQQIWVFRKGRNQEAEEAKKWKKKT